MAWTNIKQQTFSDDLLFRRFVDLSISESVPDHSTFWRFRNLLEKEGLFETLLSCINQQLTNKGLFIKKGEVSIIDASVIEAKQCRPKKNKDGNNTQDPEAEYNVKNGPDGKRKTTYGFKAHTNVDEDGFTKTYDYTKGNVHDSKVFEILLTGNEEEVYADSAYASQATNDLLKKQSITNKVLKRTCRNKPLTAEEKSINRQNSGTRSIVERTFSVLKLHYGMKKARYFGLKRNKARFGLMSIAESCIFIDYGYIILRELASPEPTALELVVAH